MDTPEELHSYWASDKLNDTWIKSKIFPSKFSVQNYPFILSKVNIKFMQIMLSNGAIKLLYLRHGQG